MINVASGWFDNPGQHHPGYFRVFRFRRSVEIWLGHRWILIGF